MSNSPMAAEALRLYDVYDQMPADRGGKNGPRGKAHQAFLDAKDAAFASPTTPVDGVGAEPFGHVWQDATDRWRFNHGTMSKEDVAFYEAQPVFLASPEAEARLRERVADAVKAERERIAKALEEDADALPCAEDAAVTRSNAQLIRADFCYEDAERLDIAAEARLAQAEGGPAVTEAMVKRAAKAIVETDHASEGLTFTELSRAMARAALEAALHPQSAAGEEGKP